MSSIDFLLNWFPILGTFFITICYIPQITKLIKTKDSTGMSISFWIYLDMALFILTMNLTLVYFVHGTWGSLVTEIVNLVLAIVVTVLVIKYRKPKE